jgi:large subunit ribosomal protein L22
MSFGTKTNERPGTRAQVKYTRVSAYKAREVLDLIRGEQVARALEILEFAERDVAQVILKCLESAIANAEHNDQIPADELYVSACFADEGPTLKRWRPRARGRATRIRKRTCHITIIVSRLAPEELERIRAREIASGGRGGGQAAAEARRQRVLRSRQSKAEKKAADAEEHDHDEHDHDHEGHDHDHEDETAETAETAETVDAATDVTDTVEDSAADDTETPDEQAGDDALADEDKDS